MKKKRWIFLIIAILMALGFILQDLLK